MKCKIQNHNNQNAEIICLEKTCQVQNSICKQCVIETHFNHKKQCIQLNQLNDYIKTQIILTLENRIVEKIDLWKTALFQTFDFTRQQKFKKMSKNQILQILQQINSESQNILSNLDAHIKENQNFYDNINNLLNSTTQIIQTEKQQEPKKIVEQQNQIIQSESLHQNQFYQWKMQKQQQEEQNKINFLAQIYLMIDSLKMQGSKYEDDYSRRQVQEDSIQLKRISEIVKGPITFFPNKSGENIFACNGKFSHISDFSEGEDLAQTFKQLIILLANFCQEKLKKVFLIQEINVSQVYGLQVFSVLNCKNWSYILDDQVKSNQRLLIGANNSIWITLLWRCVNLQLQITEVTYNDFYQMILMPGPIILYQNFAENLLQLLQDEIKANSFVLAYQFLNQFSNQFVQVLNFKLITNPILGEDTMLVQLRSPISKYLYNGDWGFQSPYWTEDLIDQLKVSDEDDGIFYIDFVNFINDYSFYRSHRIHANLVGQEKCIIKQKQGNYFKLIVENDAEYIFQLHHKKQGFLNGQLDQLDSFMVGKLVNSNMAIENFDENAEFHYHKSQLSQFPISFKVHFTPGTYVMYLKVNFHSERQNNYKGVLKVYGELPLKLTQISKIQNFHLSISKDLLQKAESNNEFQYFQLKQSYTEIGFSIEILNKSSYDKVVRLVFTLNSAKLCKPFQGNIVEKKIGKQERLFIRIKKLSPYATSQFKLFTCEQNSF